MNIVNAVSHYRTYTVLLDVVGFGIYRAKWLGVYLRV